MYNGARGHQDLGQVAEVPYQALHLLQFFTYKIRAHKKVRKGEGEPGDEATILQPKQHYKPCT